MGGIKTNIVFKEVNKENEDGYCMCPAAMLGESIIPGYEHQQIPGDYFAKRL